MNDKLNELAKKAGIQYGKSFVFSDYKELEGHQLSKKTFEEFSALLVLECLAAVDDGSATGKESAKKIIARFGDVECRALKCQDNNPDVKTPNLNKAIADLISALQATKGWVHAYAESIVLDALDRTHLSEYQKIKQALPDDIREAGWAVAVHNDYTLNGIKHTFWLFTKDNQAVKGEGLTDAEALNQVRAELGLLFA